MRHQLRPSPALIVATIALTVALGGTGWAVATLPSNSVGPNQLRPQSVHQVHIFPHSLLRSDFAPNQLPIPRSNRVVIRSASGGQVAAANAASVSVACNRGEHAVGGGGSFAKKLSAKQQDRLVASEPLSAGNGNHTGEPPTKWRVTLFNGAAVPRTPVAYVVCLSP